MDKTLKINEQEEFSMNFDDNYNEQQFMKNANKKVQKLTIMDDFNELCQKLNYLADEDKEAEKQAQNALMQYYAQCKQKIQEQGQVQRQSQKAKINQNNIITSKLNKPSPIPSQHQLRSTTDNYPLTPTSHRLQAYQTSHQRNPSQGQNAKKPLQEVDQNDNKRNYSSVQEKKKILQPSKNVAKQNNALVMKDYFGEENNFVNKKVHGKNFISKDPKTPKDLTAQQYLTATNKHSTNTNTQAMKFGNQNSLKQSNLISAIRRNQAIEKQVKELKQQKPKIILYKKVIDLTQSTEAIIEAFKNEQMKSDYEIFSQSQTIIEEGLFAKAIVHQRATKTAQSVQSPSPNNNYIQPTFKENGKQYIQSPISISYSPNPTNNYKSIFQKREIYR